jgi:hypothetical protein
MAEKFFSSCSFVGSLGQAFSAEVFNEAAALMVFSKGVEIERFLFYRLENFLLASSIVRGRAS